MALRVRKDGRILCAAMHEAEGGDTYIDDGLHYEMSVIHAVIGSECAERHRQDGQWYWMGQVPEGVEIEPWRIELSRDRGSVTQPEIVVPTLDDMVA